MVNHITAIILPQILLLLLLLLPRDDLLRHDGVGGAARAQSAERCECPEFRDLVFEDVVFDNNAYLVLYKILPNIGSRNYYYLNKKNILKHHIPELRKVAAQSLGSRGHLGRPPPLEPREPR